VGIEIREVRTKKEWTVFLHFPIQLYQKEKNYVPPILSDEKKLFDNRKNPALEFCEWNCWLAYSGHRVAGRITGIINHRYNKYLDTRTARFCWFDFVNNAEVAARLLEETEKWAREKGMNTLTGPYGFTNFQSHGILIEGFHEKPNPFSSFNFPYYSELVEKAGYHRTIEWNESTIKVPGTIPEKMDRVANWVKSRYHLRVVDNSRMKNLLYYQYEMFHLLNEAYGSLHGFVPLTDKQIEHLVNGFLKYLKSKYISIVIDQNDKLVAFGISVPDVTTALQKARGHLWPFGYFYLWKSMNWNDTIDLMLIAVRPDYQMKGVNTLLFQQLIPVYQKNHIIKVETLQNQVDNLRVQSQWDYFDRRIHRLSAGYQKEL
jgi:GNAT superfamily N-acetyltransferase